VRIRQIALVAGELEPVVRDLCGVLGLEVSFRDPGVAEFGLSNAVIPVGTQFLEVVSPIRPGTTAGRFLEKRGSDSGYMVILQTCDLDADRARLEELGVRIVWQIQLDDIRTVHLHPRDVGGAILSLDQPVSAEAWRWGGPSWPASVRTGRVAAIRAVTLQARDPEGLAERWSRVLGLSPPRPTGGGWALDLDPGAVQFTSSGGTGDAVTALELEATDREAVLSEARKRGLLGADGGVTIGGVRFDLVL